MKKILALVLMVVWMALCAGAYASGSDSVEAVQYEYPLKAGETIEVYDVTFEERVTVIVDPASTRDGSNDLRSQIYFDNCVFNGGLSVVGDYHAMISLGAGCSFGEGSVVTCEEANPGSARGFTLEDNLIKLFVACEGVCVETQSAIGVLSDGPDVVLNGTTYSKNQLAPDTAFLGVYSVYEGDALNYLKLAIGEDDSVEVLD